MNFVEHFDFSGIANTFLSYFFAFIFGALIGAERQFRQRTAGLRTNVLVAIGAAGFVDLADSIAGSTEAVRVISYVVSGIGFLGAGVIMKEGANVSGLNTAATLWCSAAVGACTGVDRIPEAALLTVFILAGNTLLRPLVNFINRADTDSVEAEYVILVTVPRQFSGRVRDALQEFLEEHRYPAADIETVVTDSTNVEIEITLISTEVDAAELDKLVEQLKRLEHIGYATWRANTLR
ncbi:MgtC/SapB family protein [Erwinia sp. JUb26]|uniref:MgtC/SapB family protein n=2 Tax=unclassified Erwinia TaxID=2622719 RepID=UPI000F4931D6|nr:MgtC/SapB family protein [Erwinia sp. JUb26]ROR15303.1 putative Mg2+ transporter-C (MgtC) family protein [Erwinia sp. JUb26]